MSLSHSTRHHFVWLKPASLSLEAESREDLAIARHWIGEGRPLVVRRRRPDDEGRAPLGLALPNNLGRGRLSLRAEASEISRVAPPPLLADLLAGLEETWRETCREIIRTARSSGAELRVYGSAAWQWLTDEVYLHPASDLDFLVQPLAGWRRERGLNLFAGMAACRTPMLDGEVCIGRDENVSWRELLLSTPEVLLRTSTSLELRPRSEIERRLQELQAHE